MWSAALLPGRRLTPAPGPALYFVEIAGDRAWASGVITEVEGQPRAGIASFDMSGR
ncbi:MAG: hypothetical protein R2708_01450 [Vicinamibacterales bacterium]